eukprot:SAG31_NODE_37162_length_306_cov_1.492754_2_plen_24_part_01
MILIEIVVPARRGRGRVHGRWSRG